MGTSRPKDEILLDVHRSLRWPSQTFDADAYYLGFDGSGYDSNLIPVRLNEFVMRVLPNMWQAASDAYTMRIAFIERRGGTAIGMLPLMQLALIHLRLEGCIVRPEMRLFSDSLKGRPVIPGERIMIVSDFADTGAMVSHAARRLRELGAVVPAAFVLLDMSIGAKENLASEGVVLTSQWTLAQRDTVLEARMAPA